MAKAENKKDIDPILFIDTNIFLDFYRARTTDTSLEYLSNIELITDRLIITSQVEMEYKRNRQRVILDTIKNYSFKSEIGTPPAIISKIKAIEMIKKSNKDIKEQENSIKEKIGKILTNPISNDKVYQSFQRIYKNATEYKLTVESEEWEEIHQLAWDRFWLGNPPRKKDDISIGDSINWEWIIHCAKKSTKDIIIVTRDGDYGALYNKKMYINDWLSHEFKSRISQKRSISITNSLASALKAFNITVSTKLVSEEAEVIKDHIENQEYHELAELCITHANKDE